MVKLSKQTQQFYHVESLMEDMLDRASQDGARFVDFHGSKLTLPEERKFGTVQNVQAYVNVVLRLNWVRAKWPERAREQVIVDTKRRINRATYTEDPPRIAIPDHTNSSGWAMRELIVLHEIAHHLSQDVDGHHGPAFLEVYFTLLEEIIGPEIRMIVYANCTKTGLKI